MLISEASFSQENFGITPVNRLYNTWGGGQKGGGFSGDYLLFNTSRNVIQVLDCSDPDTLIEVGGFDLGELDVISYTIDDAYLYVAHQEGLRIINLDNLPSVTISSNFRYDAGIRAMDLIEDDAFLITVDNRLIILDISDVNHPEQLSRTNLNMTPINIRADGETCYIVGDQFLIVDVADPENPDILWREDEPAIDIEVIDDIAILAFGENGMKFYNVSEPNNLQELAQTKFNSYRLSKVHDYLLAFTPYSYVDHEEGEIYVSEFSVFSLSNPQFPVLISGPFWGYGETLFSASGNRLVCPGSDWGKRDVVVHYFAEDGRRTGMAISNSPIKLRNFEFNQGTAYLLYEDEPYSLNRSLIVAEPNRSGTLNEIADYEMGSPQHLQAHNGFLFFYEYGEGRIRKLNIDDPANPYIDSIFFDFPRFCSGITFSGSFLYSGLSAGVNSGLLVLPVPNGNFHREGSYFLQIGAEISSRPAVYGSYAYIAARSDGFFIVDVSDRRNLREVAQIETQRNSYDLDTGNGYLYVADGNLSIYDLEDPEQPHLIHEFDPPDTLFNVELHENYALLYIRDPRRSRKALMILDVSDPENPEISGYQSAIMIQDVAIESNLLYLTDVSGLAIFDISDAMSSRKKITPTVKEFVLIDPAYPNPFNSSTSVNLKLAIDANISLELYDISGRKVADIVDNLFYRIGTHTLTIKGDELPSGYFFIRLEVNEKIYSQPLIFIR